MNFIKDLFKKKEDGWTLPSGIDWKNVLHKIYLHEPFQYEHPKYFNDEHPLVKELKISGERVESAISFLENQDLIKTYEKKRTVFVLTEKGFNVALQNAKEISELKIQFALLAFSGVVALTSVADILLNANNVVLRNILSIFFVLFFVILEFVRRKMFG